MTRYEPAPAAQDYEIVLGRLARSGEIDVWGLEAPRPMVGETFTVACGRAVYGVVVERVAIGATRGWGARCKVIDQQWT